MGKSSKYLISNNIIFYCETLWTKLCLVWFVPRLVMTVFQAIRFLKKIEIPFTKTVLLFLLGFFFVFPPLFMCIYLGACLFERSVMTYLVYYLSIILDEQECQETRLTLGLWYVVTKSRHIQDKPEAIQPHQPLCYYVPDTGFVVRSK
jgi:hypothetical protein